MCPPLALATQVTPHEGFLPKEGTFFFFEEGFVFMMARVMSVGRYSSGLLRVVVLIDNSVGYVYILCLILMSSPFFFLKGVELYRSMNVVLEF